MTLSTDNRVKSLDWLRGLMAISIMFYHLIYWNFFPLDASSLLGRLGVYAVSIFFVISGLSMAIVYSNFIVNKQTAAIFYVRRIFRIWPLLWVCILLAIAPVLAKGGEVSVVKIFANMTTLFGFISPGSYINVGAWSIGNEMVYYAFTPFIITLYKKSKKAGNALLLISLMVTMMFAFLALNSEKSLSDQWSVYINPFNNLFLYVSGISIYYNLRDLQIKPNALSVMLAVSLSIFVFYPVNGNNIVLVTGMNRMVFLVASVLLVVFFYKFSRYDIIPGSIRYSLEMLGIATYGVYLLHPIINAYIGNVLEVMGIKNPIVLFVSVVPLTIVTAIAGFNVFEKRIIKFGKLLTSNALWIKGGHAGH